MFPSDEDGDTLWAMHLAGDDLTLSREVHFSVLFDSESKANSYAAEMQEAALDTQVDDCGDTYDIPAWEAVTTANIVPSYERITALTDLLATIAASHSGEPTGWVAELSPNNSFKPKPLRGTTLFKR